MNDAPACPPADPEPRGPTRFAMPPGAVDSHAHVIGLPPEYPFIANRAYTPPEATPAALVQMMDRAGLHYAVLAQVSVHGMDNRLMVRTLRAHPDRLRGVATVPRGLASSDLRKMRDAGVCGLRINVVFGGGVGLEALPEYGSMCEDMGWHLEVLLDARELPAVAPRLSQLRVPVVVDHMGHFPAEGGLQEKGFQTLVSLVRDGGWVKLSAPYRLCRAPYPNTIPLAHALLQAAPSRCVWGSDWPHVANFDRTPNPGELLDLLADWAPDEALRHAVLVSNPARLYGFPALP